MLLAGLAAWFIYKKQVLPAIVVCAAFAALLAYGILKLFSGRKRALARRNGRAEERLNPAKILRALKQIASAIDGDAENLYGMLIVPAAEESVDGVDLAQALLRVSTNAPGTLPREAESALATYFARHGIEVILYSPENRAMFTVLPSNGDKTIEPALVMNDKLLKTGVACTKGV